MRGLLRVLNTMFWCWIALSNVLSLEPTLENFWTERVKLLFELGPLDNPYSLLARAVLPVFLWLFIDWTIRSDRPRAERPNDPVRR